MVLQVLCTLFLLPALLACAYSFLLALVGVWSRRPVVETHEPPRHTFAILIPAHDEEAVLATALHSCEQLDYPKDHYRVYVIADNCSDRTAEVAWRLGAVCLERHDDQQRGKGAALAWALDRILPERPDAVLVLDADCRLDAATLRAFDRRFTAGAKVLQASDVASNPDDSIVSYVTAVANRIENELFYAPKSLLGLAVLLRGTGMAFRREVLERFPWQACSIVEDAEHTVRLAGAGIRVEFAPEVSVSSAFPARARQLAVQRRRWIGGTVALARRHMGRLLLQGLCHGSPALLDLAWTLWVAGRALVLLQLLLTLMLASLCLAWVPGAYSEALLAVGMGVVAVHGAVFLLAAGRLGMTSRRWALLGRSPAAIVQLLFIALIAWAARPRGHWERAPR